MRAILFCNEMLGLGHLRRSLVIAEALTTHGGRDDAALVVTGSPAFGGMPAPKGVDILKIPSAPVTADSRWSATVFRPTSGLSAGAAEVLALRAELARTSVEQFRPDIVISDQRPFGRERELRPALDAARALDRCTVALGLWEVDDARERLACEWSPALVDDVMRVYDLAIVHGASAPDDVRIERLRAAGLPLHHTSLVGMPPAARGPADLGDGYLLALVGGGVDGFGVLDAVLGACEAGPIGAPAVLVTGPFMDRADVARLRERAARVDVRVCEFRSDMDAVMGGARAIVAMAGYCTVAEIVSSGKPALLVPRAFPREEQLNRARRLASTGRVMLLEPAHVSALRMREALLELLAQPSGATQRLTGAAEAASILATWPSHFAFRRSRS